MAEYHTDLNEFYRRTIDIIYAFVIGQSFLQLDTTLIPIRKIFDLHGAVDLGAIFLAYFILIWGWIAWHKSIKVRPHIGKFGNLRYAVDLFSVFLVYYLLRIAKPDVNTTYGETFVWVIPLIFVTYSFWDLLKFIEYQKQSEEMKVKPKRVYITIIFGFMFLFLSCFYTEYVSALKVNPQNFWGTKNVFDGLFIIIALVLTTFYRLSKWEIEASRRMTS